MSDGLPAGVTVRRHGVVLGLIGLVALALRVPGWFWGYELVGDHIPYVQLHPDEPRFVEMVRALDGEEPLRGSYVLGLGNWLRLVSGFAKAWGYEMSDVALVLAARVTNTAAGMGLVLIVYALTLRLTGGRRWTGMFAAALVALNTMLVTHSAYGTADMTYVLLVYSFALLVLVAMTDANVMAATAASAVAGIAMAVKFGFAIVPSVLLLAGSFARVRRLNGFFGLVALCLVAFLTAQGFAFRADFFGDLYASVTQDNLSAVARNKWWNPVVYGVQLVRGLGLPVALLGGVGLVARVRSRRRWEWSILVAGLPVLLHGGGILFLSTTFPRHLLLLVPALIIAAAVVVSRLVQYRDGIAVLCLLWSGVLAITDNWALWRDGRGQVFAWMAAHVSQETEVWADPYFKIPVGRFYPSVAPQRAKVLLLHEGWIYRFRRSELNPFAVPERERELYHARPAHLAWYRELKREIADGHWIQAAESRSPTPLPEQRLYDWLWGSFNKFAGKSRALVRATPGLDS